LAVSTVVGAGFGVGGAEVVVVSGVGVEPPDLDEVLDVPEPVEVEPVEPVPPVFALEPAAVVAVPTPPRPLDATGNLC
jgi:hypothetical protein